MKKREILEGMPPWLYIYLNTRKLRHGRDRRSAVNRRLCLSARRQVKSMHSHAEKRKMLRQCIRYGAELWGSLVLRSTPAVGTENGVTCPI